MKQGPINLAPSLLGILAYEVLKIVLLLESDYSSFSYSGCYLSKLINSKRAPDSYIL